MDRREFFKLGFLQVKDQARKSAPEIIRREITPTLLDLTVLTSHVDKAEQLIDDMVAEHFGERFLRLRQSTLAGMFPGGLLLFEGTRRRDHHDGVTLLFGVLRELEEKLQLSELQSDPTLLRYVNRIPAFSRTAEIYRGNRLVQAIPLYEDVSHEVEGAQGMIRIAVEDKRLRVVSSPCAHGICAAHPPIITPGQRITCVPGDVSIGIGLQE